MRSRRVSGIKNKPLSNGKEFEDDNYSDYAFDDFDDDDLVDENAFGDSADELFIDEFNSYLTKKSHEPV
ncbi:hypothetical protein V6N13_029673 [Hibiscus sabdariffa]|uniref:Uncharacterized protein n=2 Tax=Hibiscus sabdariffa TaxID=183260 RepID=A0ABR2T995_9ROSI